MRNLKKVIALIAVFAMVLTTATFAASFPDVEAGSAAAEAISTLADLSILKGDENGNYNPDAVVTRAEMATIIARIQGYEGDIAATATSFTDVPSTHWASGYVALAAGQGIVNGYGDGKFGPDDTVKYEEAIKMIMVTLGYEPMAADQGGYPAGYIAAANSQKVLSGVTGGVTGQGCARSTIAQLVYNAIDTALMIRTGYGTESSYVVTGTNNDYHRQTLMSERLDITKLKGFVLANEVTSLKDGNVDIDTDAVATVEIRVNGNFKNTGSEKYGDISVADKVTPDMTFRIGDSNAGSFLGKQVVFYVQEDNYNDDDVILSITEETSKNNEVSFTLDQYDGIDVTDRNTTINYLKNPTDRTAAKLRVQSGKSDEVFLVYNGVSVGITNLETYFTNTSGGSYVSPDSKVGGKVTMLDTDSTTGYDVIMIEIAATAVVDKISGNTVRFKANAGNVNKYNNRVNNIQFDEDATDFICTITKDGKAIEYTELKEWDVLSIVTNNDVENVYDVRVVSNQLDGKINSTKPSKTSATEVSLRIDGKDYDVAEGYYANGTMKAGAVGMFYIDEYGKIAAYDKNGSSQAATNVADNYGYVLDARDSEDEFENQSVRLKLLTNKKGVVELLLANSVTVTEGDEDKSIRIDGTTIKYDDKVIKATELAKMFKNQLIRFGVSSNDSKINSVEFAVTNPDNDTDFTLAGYAPNASYDESTQRLNAGGRFDIDETTTVFYITNADANLSLATPSGGKLNVTGTADADSSSIATGADLAEGDDFACAVYDEDETTGIAKVVVVFNQDGMVSPSTSMAVIDSISRSVDEYSDYIYTIEYYQDGEKKTANTTSDVYDDRNENGLIDANRGDIFKFAYDEAGVIKKAQKNVIFGGSDNLRTELAASANGNAFDAGLPTISYMAKDSGMQTYYAGSVVGFKSSTNSLTLRLANGTEESFKVNNTGVYVYDPELRDTRRLSVGDTSFFDVDEDLVDANGVVYERTGSGAQILVKDTPALGMLGYAIVRVYDGDAVEVLYVAPYDYKGYDVRPKAATVAVTGVSLDKTEATLEIDGTVTLAETVAPANASDKTVTWTSSDEAVATVANGVVTAKAAGEATITVTTKDGSKTATCKITVNAADAGEPPVAE